MAEMYTPDPRAQVMIAKDRLRGLLPAKIIKRINSVTEEYMLDRQATAIKVRFCNGVWSTALLLSEEKSLDYGFSDYKDIAMNPDEFVANCCMIYEAGEVHDA